MSRWGASLLGRWRWPRGWRRVGLALFGVGTIVVVALGPWGRLPGWLRDTRGMVAGGLDWLRLHWLSSSSLGVVIAALGLLLAYWLPRRQAHAAREALLAAHCWVDPASKGLVRVTSIQDPVTLGIHPAAGLEDMNRPTNQNANGPRGERMGLPARVPVYVPRDLDALLDAALARALANGGLVLVRGDSTAGKSRAAFEAMRRLPGDLSVLVPHQRGSLRALLDGGVELRSVVVWLNDLERWMGADGLDVGLLRRLLGEGDRRVLVLATMRASEYNARSPEHERSQDAPERDLLRAERELLDQAVDLELPRWFSEAERKRAGERVWDPRIADALAHAGEYGLAEYLAAGPRLWLRWRNARAVDNLPHEQAGAAIVAAALDCRRAGLSRAVPTRLLQELYPIYLDLVVAERLAPAALDQGLRWATTPVQATSALLVADQGGYVVFDYLLDRLQANQDAPAVPERVWECLLADLHTDDAFNVGLAAFSAERDEFAEQAWRSAANAGHHGAAYNLGLLLTERGDLDEAERWYRGAANAGHSGAAYNLGFLLAERDELEEAERWWRRAADAGHHNARTNLGFLLAEREDLKEAERWNREAADTGPHDAETKLEALGKEESDLERADRWWRRAADRWWRRAADTGLDTEYSTGLPPTRHGALERRRWTIPPPVQSFTGRDELLLSIRRQLVREGTTALVPTTALHGLGGVGKTQLALAYAYRYRDDYSLGWWIPADSELSITTAFAALAVALGMSTELSPRELADSARKALAERAGWLLIFDNASDPIEVAKFLPAGGKGHVLLTSRSPAWQGIAASLPVDVLSLDESVELLQRRSGDSDRHAAEALAVELGQLALALEQAAAYAGQYLAAYERPLARYLELFRNRQAELLAKGQPLAYSGRVDTTFTLTMDQLRDSNSSAVTLLEIFAFLAADEIPVQLLLSRPNELPSPIAHVVRDPLATEEMIAALFEVGLLIPDRRRTGVARTHRIVQMVTVAHISGPDRRQRIKQAIELVAALFPDEGWLPGGQQRCAQLLPHARAVLRHATATRLTTPAVAQLLLTVGSYLYGTGLALGEARDLQRQALAINRRLYQRDHPNIARSLNGLGAVLRRLGVVEQARDLDTEALAMCRRLYRGDHPDLARSLSSVAADLRRLGEVEQARDLDTEALAMCRRLYRGDHPDLARSLSGLAMDLRTLEELDRARELDTEALGMRRRLYQGDHPDLASSMGNLAVDLHLLGATDEARELDIEALEMRLRLYQGDHPDIATNFTNLANALYMAREFNQALELDTQALAMRRRLYGGDHPAIAESLHNLALDMRALGQADEAKELLAQASAIDEPQSKANQFDAAHAGSGLSDVAVFLLWTGRRVRAFRRMRAFDD